MQDDGGDVLGNLPRSRPGRRSEKRTGSAKKPATAAKAPRSTPRKPASKRSTPPRRPPAADPQPARGGANPIEDAVLAATKVAETGLRVAGGVTREVLRRVPRP